MLDLVHELAANARDVARPLFAAATFDRVFVDAYFEGRQIGRLFVDDPERPTGALLCRSYDYVTAGEPAPSLVRFIADAPAEAGVFSALESLDAARRQPTIAFYGFVPLTRAWGAALIEAQPGLETIGRRAFRFPAGGDPPPWSAPEGFTLHAIDADLARRIDADLDELIALFWGDYATFAAQGFGVCAMAGDELASVAYAIATSATEANIGVGTAEPFQRRGLAAAVSRAAIAQAIERGLTPTWDCDTAHAVSGHLAGRLGFTEEPSFVELAFPERAAPTSSTGRWSCRPAPTGLIWSSR